MNRRERVAEAADHLHLLSDGKMKMMMMKRVKKATIEQSHRECADSPAKAPAGEEGHRKDGGSSRQCCWYCSGGGDVNV